MFPLLVTNEVESVFIHLSPKILPVSFRSTCGANTTDLCPYWCQALTPLVGLRRREDQDLSGIFVLFDDSDELQERQSNFQEQPQEEHRSSNTQER